MILLRSYIDNVELMEWLENFIWPTEAKFVSHQFVCKKKNKKNKIKIKFITKKR